MLFSLLLCVIGLVFLTLAADKLVEGASNLALNMGVSKMAVGLTIVAAGTSLPELVVSIKASLAGSPAISLGNVVGSNIVNASFILGLAALIYPIACEKEMVRREAPIMIAVTGLLWYFASTGSIITPNEGLVLFGLFVAYTSMSYYLGRKENVIAEEFAEKAESVVAATNDSQPMPTTVQNLGYILAGLVGLVIGAEALVRGAVDIAQSFGISDEIIGLTLIAVGTSLPELATSIVAARKGQSDIALGNVVGSNIFNILGIVGCSAVLPLVIPGATAANYLTVSPNMLGMHIPLMMVVSLGVLPIMRTGMRIVRLEGALLVAVYIAYSVMIFQSSGSEAQTPVKPIAAIETPAQGNGQSSLPALPESVKPIIDADKAIASEPVSQLASSADLSLNVPASSAPVVESASDTLPTENSAGLTASGAITP